LNRSYEDQIKFTFKNESGASTNVLWLINGILIPTHARDAFEAEIKSLADTSFHLKRMRKVLGEALGRRPEFEEED